ncbi:MAG: phosphoribosyltransferase [Cytophagaceae bacterium]|jgi:pyrimidine operon attenuation protein/uracil phosphoribosyltransferase|nr:phosphoribosyltransferase [Cytophagaceae bacterium]
MAERTLLLDKRQTLQKIKRMAFEIFEQNYQEKEVVIAGIDDNGYLFGALLAHELEAISPLSVKLVKVSLDKYAKLQCPVQLDVPLTDLENKVVIITDDVLNTGRTLSYSLQPFLSIPLKKIQIAVVVNRSHNTFPVSADYIGYSLATTLKEHIEVVVGEPETGVYIR